jgi:adenylate cyclase
MLGRSLTSPRRFRGKEAQNSQLVASWLETLTSLLQSAAGGSAFLNHVAEALVDLADMDRCLVLLRHGTAFEVAGRSAPPQGLGLEFDLGIVQRVVAESRTVCASDVSAPRESFPQAETVLACPVFDDHARVIGVVYGARTAFCDIRAASVQPVEVQLGELLASAVGLVLARVEQEAEVTQLRHQFEQFLSTQLAGALQQNPRLLEGQEREVTVLFCDICGFSHLAERLGPRITCRLVVDVMELVTRRIREWDGNVVDYYGDGLLAMWNAPADQPEHARLACRAALGIRDDLPLLAAAWQEVLGGPLALGIAVNTGPALVGNTGSRQKVKYGPIGHTVNLAHRVEGLIKHFGLPVLLTGSTRALLRDSFATRRLCRVRISGLQSPVDLYELHAEAAPPEWLPWRDAYETGLALFEAGQWGAACRAIYPLLAGQEGHYDLACLHLVGRAVECLKAPPGSFDAVLELKGK